MGFPKYNSPKANHCSCPDKWNCIKTDWFHEMWVQCCRHQLNRQCILFLNMYCVAMFPEGVYRRWDDFIVYSQLPIVQLLNVLNMSLWSFKCYLMNIFLVKPLISSAYFTTKWILFCYRVSIKLLFITINRLLHDWMDKKQ